jgi:hypothetical protein
MIFFSERTGLYIDHYIPRTQTSRVHNDALKGLLVVRESAGWLVRRPYPNGGSQPVKMGGPFQTEQIAEKVARRMLGLE